MTKIVTLKNSSDEEVYPITTAEAVNGGLYADSEGTPSTVTADITSARIADSAVTTNKVADNTVTSDKIDWTSLGTHYKSCPAINPFNIPTAWTRVVPSGWSMTFPTNAGEVYRVEIMTGYLCWNGAASTELDMHLGYTGATLEVHPASSTMTGTYGGGASIGRSLFGILRATGSSMTVRAEIAAGSTGNYARIEVGHIFVMRIG